MRGLRADAKCLNRSSPAARLVPSESARCRVQTHRDSRVPSHTGQQIVEAVRWILVTHQRGVGKSPDRPPIDAPITKSYRPFGLRAVNGRVVAPGRGSVFECVHRSFSAPCGSGRVQALLVEWGTPRQLGSRKWASNRSAWAMADRRAPRRRFAPVPPWLRVEDPCLRCAASALRPSRLARAGLRYVP